MAAKAEVLTSTTVTRSKTDRERSKVARHIITSFAEWARRGQLGASNYTELGRHTGGRI